MNGTFLNMVMKSRVVSCQSATVSYKNRQLVFVELCLKICLYLKFYFIKFHNFGIDIKFMEDLDSLGSFSS